MAVWRGELILSELALLNAWNGPLHRQPSSFGRRRKLRIYAGDHMGQSPDAAVLFDPIPGAFIAEKKRIRQMLGASSVVNKASLVGPSTSGARLKTFRNQENP